MTVLQIPGDEGKLLVHSPVELSEEVQRELATLGEPAVFVAPSHFHDLYWKPYLSAYQGSSFLAPPGMPVPGNFDSLVESSIWSDDLHPIEVQGMPNVQEHVIYHRPSKSLIVADLAFNLKRGSDFATRCFEKMAGIYDHFAASRLFQSFIRDQKLFGKSIARILELDFQQIIMGHGQVQAVEAKNMLKRVYNRYLPI